MKRTPYHDLMALECKRFSEALVQVFETGGIDYSDIPPGRDREIKARAFEELAVLAKRALDRDLVAQNVLDMTFLAGAEAFKRILGSQSRVSGDDDVGQHLQGSEVGGEGDPDVEGEGRPAPEADDGRP